MPTILCLILGCSIVGLLSLYDGFILMKCWAWFIIPTFGLPVLSMPAAIGICLIVAFLTHQKETEDSHKSDEEKLIDKLSYGLSTNTVLFAIAWVVHLFL